MKKIFFYVILIIVICSISSCATILSQEKIDEKAYEDKVTNLLNDYSPIVNDLADATWSVNLGGENGIVYHKEICKEFIKSTDVLYKNIADLIPPEKYKDSHNYLMKAMDSALKVAVHLQKYVDTEDNLKMQEELLAARDDLQDFVDYISLSEREDK